MPYSRISQVKKVFNPAYNNNNNNIYLKSNIHRSSIEYPQEFNRFKGIANQITTALIIHFGNFNHVVVVRQRLKSLCSISMT